MDLNSQDFGGIQSNPKYSQFSEIIYEIIQGIENPSLPTQDERQVQEEIYGLQRITSIEQYLPNLCGFYALFNTYFSSCSIILFWKFYFQLTHFLDTIFQGDFIEFQELQRYHLEYILINQVVKELPVYKELKINNTELIISTFMYGYHIVQNSQEELLILQKQFDELGQRRIKCLTLICGITIHFLVIKLAWQEEKLRISIIDSQNENIQKLFTKQLLIDKTRDKEKRRRQAYKIDLRNALIIIQEILNGKNIIDCYLDHACLALRESFEENENDIGKWLKDEYPLPVIRSMIFRVAENFGRKCSNLKWLLDCKNKELLELQNELSKLI